MYNDIQILIKKENSKKLLKKENKKKSGKNKKIRE